MCVLCELVAKADKEEKEKVSVQRAKATLELVISQKEGEGVQAVSKFTAPGNLNPNYLYALMIDYVIHSAEDDDADAVEILNELRKIRNVSLDELIRQIGQWIVAVKVVNAMERVVVFHGHGKESEDKPAADDSDSASGEGDSGLRLSDIDVDG